MANLQDKSVFISLHCSALGVNRKINKDRVDTTADKRLVSLNKKLFKSDTYQKIVRLQSQARSYLMSRAIQTGLRGAVYALPVAFVGEVEQTLDGYVSQMKEHVSTLCDEWEHLVTVEAPEQLGDLYNRHDYPTAEYVSTAFAIRWRYVATDVPGSLADISGEVFTRERKKLEQEFARATDYTKAIMRKTCLEFVSAFHDQLQPRETTGKKKQPIHHRTLEKLTDFMETFEVRNLANDDDMKTAVGTMRKLLAGVSVKKLRDDDNFKVALSTAMDSTVSNLEGLVEDCPVRDVIFDD